MCDRRKERYSSPDVNPDGSLQTPEYEEDIEAIGETKRTEEPTSNGLLSRSTWFLLALILAPVSIAVYVSL